MTNKLKSNELNLKDKDFEQQCLKSILARTTSLAMMIEPGELDELTRYSSIAMSLSSCIKSLDRQPIYSSALLSELSSECDGDCENCELNCEDECFGEDDE